MGKITKKPQEKHKSSISPAVSKFVTKLTSVPLIELPNLFESWSQRWPYPRGDLMNWVEPLDRFDDVLRTFISRYGLDVGPQTIPFGASMLLEGDPGVDEARLKELGFGQEADREVIESILDFSRLLVEKCANRAIYNSTDRLNDLLNTTSLSLLHVTLRLTIFLAQRYSERASPSALPIPKFYDYDHDRLRRLATPIGQHLVPSRRTPTSPVKMVKGKEKFPSATRPRRASSVTNPNDFRALCRDSSAQNASGKSPAASDREWQSWAYLKVDWPSKTANTDPAAADGAFPGPSAPSSPTPLRRQSGSTVARSAAANATTQNGTPHSIDTSGVAPALEVLEFTPSDLAKMTIEQVLSQVPENMPSSARYELLHKLRIAYGLTSSAKCRRHLLAVRMLAINAVGNVFPESELSQNLLGQDQGNLKPQELVQQLVNLIQDPKKSQASIPLYLQTLSMETLGVLARHKTFATDINAALGANSSNGLLLRLTQRGLTDISTDDDATDDFEGDDWREAVFSMPRVVIEAAGHHGRTSESVISSSFITTYVSGLNATTDKAMRVHLRMLDFIKTFFHHFKDGLQALLGTNTFEIVSSLLGRLAGDSLKQVHDGRGIPADFKTRLTDYDIPYINQQIIRSVIDMINDISGHQGPNADRVLRGLIDSQPLLVAIKLIMDELSAFGSYTWSEVMKALCNFLNNEPTSYTMISEAGIIKSFLDTITGPAHANVSDGPKTFSSVPSHEGCGIPVSIEAIINIAHLFEAICLTTAGFDVFKASGALQKFFQIFESPTHVSLMKDMETVRHLGQTFDELVRHHPNLRRAVISAVTVMLARTRHIARTMAFEIGAGPKLWLENWSDGSQVSGGSAALRIEIVPPPRPDTTAQPSRLKPINLPNGDTLSFHDENDSATISSPEDHDKDGLSAPDYVKSAIAFVSSFFRTQSLCIAFLETGGADIILDLVTLPSVPIDEHSFAMPGFLDELAGVIHMMVEVKPSLILPVLADRARYACNQLKDFTQCQPHDASCYFAPLVLSASDPGKTSQSDVEKNGTHLVKSLMAVHSLCQVMSEVFNSPIYSTRATPNVFSQVNLADVFADLCRLLGTVSAACYREEIALQRAIRDPWLKATKPENFTTGYDDVDQILDVWESGPSISDEAARSSNSETQSAEQGAQESEQLKKDRTTAAFKNVKALRYLLIETPAAVTEFFNNIGHGIVPKRRPETFGKQKTALVADALAGAYVNQLQPYFLKDVAGEDGLPKEARFAYLVIALTNLRSSFYDDLSNSSPRETCQTFVIEAFRKAGGVRCLVNIGTEFFNELKQCKVEKSMFSANTGLKICLDILDELTNPKTITESPQASNFKNQDPSKPFYFLPAQLLLELRMQALPLARLIWDSDYADQASKDVVQRLISILKHVLSGDYELEAIQHDNEHPTLAPFSRRRFNIDPQKVAALKEKGFDEELAREALYRTNTQHNSNPTASEEYCKAIEADASRQRLPIPTPDTDVPAITRETPATSAPVPGQSSAPSGPIEAASAEVVSTDEDDGDEMEDVTQSSIDSMSEPTPRLQPSTSSAMDLSNILNEPERTTEEKSGNNDEPNPQISAPRHSVESIDAERESIRESLAERCNNILNTHPDLAFELSDLISSATKKLSSGDIKGFWELTSSLLVQSLLSMQTDEEITESRGKKIAAAAHLTALLIQDNDVFRMTIGVFQESFDELLAFLTVPNISHKTDEVYPWVAPILLILERMLSKDSEPAQITWTPPTDLDACTEPQLSHVPIVDMGQKEQLFALLVELLPRVGKDKGMALSIARVLVMVTRTRHIALKLGEKRNLQRLFLMIKQLGYATSSRLLSSFMLTLRHIVEDEDTVRQIMRSEIAAAFTGRNIGRQLDATSYTRELYHLVLRSPEIFVEVTKETLKLASWQPNSPGQGLTLKETSPDDPTEPKPEENDQASVIAAEDPSDQAAKSVEVTEAGQNDSSRSKNSEVKPPVVEHPDGVIHFILSELLSYKDVEDREPTAPTSDKVSNGVPQEPSAPENSLISAANGLVAASGRLNAVTRQLSGTSNAQDSSSHTDGPSQVTPETKHEKPKFKPEDHPIFVYRCFLLNSLVELLHSYNRTKVEFINFSRKSDPMTVTPSKPRSGILNYVLNGLVASGYVDKDEHSIHCKKRLAVSDWAIKVVVALCSKTGEQGLSGTAARYTSTPQIDDADDEPELTFVRRFVLEHAIRAFKDATSSSETLQAKYSKLLCLSDMFNRLLTKPAGPEGSAGVHNTSYKVLGRMMFDKNLISVLTSSLAEIDLSHTGARRVVKFILRPLQDLTTIATQLSLTSPEAILSVLGNTSDDDIPSASSVSEVADEREETPDLYRNSALGMLDPTRVPDSDSEAEDEDEDEEMYDEDDYGDEMDYDDGMPGGQEGDEAVSDEDEDGHMPNDGPIEGLPGDVPMELEFVVNEPGMEVDTDDDEEDDSDDEDDEEDDEEDEDEDEEEEDGEDFLIEGEDGEITADNENNSLGEGQDDEGDWEDEDGEDDDHENEDGDEEAHEVTFDHDEADVLDATAGQGATSLREFSNLLHALGGGNFEAGGPGQMARDLVVPPVQPIEPGDENDPDEEDEEEDMDENDEMDYVGFDDVMDGNDDLLDEGGWDYPRWEDAPRRTGLFPPRRSLATRAAVRSHPPGFLSRRLAHWPADGSQFAPPMAAYSRMTARSRGGRPEADDGTNPLLQRPSPGARSPGARDDAVALRRGLPAGLTGLEGLPGFASMMVPPMPMGGGTLSTVIQAGHDAGGHGAMIDAIFQALHRGDRNFLQGGHRININMSGPLGEFREIIHPDMTLSRHRHHHREDPPKAVSFHPATTTTRWQEEARLLFGNTYVDLIPRVQQHIMSLLVPHAQKEEKQRRQKQQEEAKAQREREEEEKKKAEVEAEAERVRREEEEERDVAARAVEEARQRAETEVANAAAAEVEAQQTNQDDAAIDEPMEDVQPAESSPPHADAGESNTADLPAEEASSAQPRVFTTIRGRQLDITGLAIDVEYLEALPEDLREEVIMQQYATRREEAQQQSGNADAAGIDPEFLDALPEDIREEIRQQEAHAQRRRERDAARRQAATAGAVQPQAGDMDNDDFLATLDPALRRAILAEQPVEILEQLAPRHAAEGREHARRLFHYTGIPVGRDPGAGRSDRLGQRDAKRQVVQLINKAGVATLLRLMFLPQQGSLRSNLWQILRNVCGNRQTRFEVISMLLVILKEGSTDVTAVERSLANLSLRAKAPAAQRTPQPLKRTLSMQPNAGLSEEVTPLVVVQQCLSALKQLSQHGIHVRTIFLREVDISSSSKFRKGKTKEEKTTKYPINDLIGLLDRKLIMDSSSCLQSLSELLSAVTSPLAALMRMDKKQEQKDVAAEQPDEQGQNEATTSEAQPQPTADSAEPGVPEDAIMAEAPTTTVEAPPTNAEPSTEAELPSAETAKPSETEAPAAEPEEPKTKKFEPPVIPEHNLQLIVSIFVAQECNAETFHSTLETMRCISSIPGTSEVFSRELINHVKRLSRSLRTDLDDFIPLVREAQNSTDLHGITSSKFSHSGSDQVKMLQVLKALDYLSEPKKDDEPDGNAAAKTILTASYESLSLGPLWDKLSECLTVIREKDNVIAFANILLPLVESLMVVCKNTSLKDAPLARQLREQAPTTPTIEGMDDLEKLFFNFTTEHRKILNDIIRQSPKLMQGNGSFSLLVKNPKVLDFDNKRAYFTKQIHSRLHQQRHVQPPLQLNVRRDQVFQDSYKALYFKSADEMKYGKLNIRFNGEEGVDAGGVTREWFQVLARGIFNPDWALWQPVASDRTTFHPNPLSWINGEHLVYFKFIGRIIGKALHEGRVLDCHFSRAVYKRMLGKQPNLKDLESMDLDYYKSLLWILENDITDIITEDFSVIEEQFGDEKVVDLIENGRNIPVVEANKREYVQKLVEYRLTTSVTEQLEHFVKGFHDIIPAELVAIFDEQELELLISGLPEIDVDDWKANTEYHNYNANSPQVTWFWRIVRSMSNEERAKLLQFITGTSKVPLNGFKDLEGMQGTTRFSIHRDPSSNRLPTSHTCFNQLDLPAYDNQDTLKSNIMTAINLGADYFGFA